MWLNKKKRVHQSYQVPRAFFFHLIYSVCSQQWNYGSCPSRRSEKVKGGMLGATVKAALLRIWYGSEYQRFGQRWQAFSVDDKHPSPAAASRPRRCPQSSCYLLLMLTPAAGGNQRRCWIMSRGVRWVRCWVIKTRQGRSIVIICQVLLFVD